MAVLMLYPGLSVVVLVDGESLTDYPTENTPVDREEQHVRRYFEGITSTNYIEAVEGKQFKIKIDLEDGFNFSSPFLSFATWVDGKLISSPMLRKVNFDKGRREWIVQGRMKADGEGSVLQTMSFSAIDTTDDNITRSVLEVQKALVSQLGDITVVVHRRALPIRDIVNVASVNDDLDGFKVQSKLLSKDFQTLRTSLSDGTSVANRKVVNAQLKYPDGKDFPLAIFKFKYRTYDALRALMVIPSSPDPEPSNNVATSSIPAPISSPASQVPTSSHSPTAAPYTPIPPNSALDAHMRLAQEFMAKQKQDLDMFMRALSVTPGPRDSPNVPTVKAEEPIKLELSIEHEPGTLINNLDTPTGTVKRNRQDNEGPATTPVKKKQKTQKLKVTTIIDLTSDDETEAIVLE
ncbi:hypothetical protein BKA65DRAFT_599289 [Rhexocercosporidium sp. MPI-PUGE-AT-0058]|nr:hypothetical protein BKA65DRAFT_599289 [Rhexocercosporidium sp. MPI-PUGE-AT-0058]